MREHKYIEFSGHVVEQKLDLYAFTENEKAFKKLYESPDGYLLMTPMYIDQLKKLMEEYPFLPQTYDFKHQAFAPDRRTAQYNLKHPEKDGDSGIFMCQHERYCYPVIHTHSYVEAIYVYDGHCRQLICGRTIELNKGDFCILSPDAPHCILAFEDDNIILNFLIQKQIFNSAFFDVLGEKHLLARFFSDILYNNRVSPYLIFPTGEDAQIRALAEQMYKENYFRRKYYGKFMTTYFRELMLRLLRDYEMEAVVPSPIDTKLNHQIVAILNYIHVNYAHVTLKELASFFNYSENYLSGVLKEYTGASFSSLIQSIQMKHSARFLTETDMSIPEIAQTVGCFDVSHFNKKFKRAFNMTPLQYRKTHTRST